MDPHSSHLDLMCIFYVLDNTAMCISLFKSVLANAVKIAMYIFIFFAVEIWMQMGMVVAVLCVIFSPNLAAKIIFGIFGIRFLQACQHFRLRLSSWIWF